MRLTLLLCLLPISAGVAAAADCRDEIVALFDGGPLDPFVQPPLRYDTTVTAEDGTVRFEYITVFDTPMKSMSGRKGDTMYLSIESRTWSGPGPEGPWTELANSLPDDIEAFHRNNHNQLVSNISEAECLGPTTIDGQPYVSYRYKTQTGPNPDNTYFGGVYTVFVDPETNRLMRQEQRAAFAHYQPQPGTDTSVLVYSYDPAFALTAPN